MQPTVYLVSNAMHMYAVYILFTAVLGKSKLHQFAEILTYRASEKKSVKRQQTVIK